MKDSNKACFKIGAKGNAPLKKFYLKFTQSDKGDKATYVNVPLLEIDLDDTKIDLALITSNSITCVKGGSSFAIEMSVAKYPPIGELVISFTGVKTDNAITPQNK